VKPMTKEVPAEAQVPSPAASQATQTALVSSAMGHEPLATDELLWRYSASDVDVVAAGGGPDHGDDQDADDGQPGGGGLRAGDRVPGE
jgi:hypothetical protein